MPPGAAFAAEGVRGFLHLAAVACRGGVVLAHGAGGSCEAPILVAAASAFADAGFGALRIDLPFRQRRPSGPPPRGSGPADREGLRRAAEAIRGLADGPILLGGHSYGGRRASELVAEDPAVADGLLLLSYPLHPPKQPDTLRTAHFPRLRRPVVFVHGAADAFGAPDELRRAAAAIPASVAVIEVPGAGHDLRRGRLDFSTAIETLFAQAIRAV